MLTIDNLTIFILIIRMYRKNFKHQILTYINLC
jgi:hypothetical protein